MTIKELVVLISVFTRKFTSAALSLCGLAHTSLGGLFVMATHLHLTKETFALHLLFQGAQRLFHVVITYDDFYQKNIPPFGIFE